MGAAAPSPPGSARTLPALRQDLRLHAGPRSASVESWLIHDPVRHRYFQVSACAFELLQQWRAEASDEFAKTATAALGREISETEVKELAVFLIANNLSNSPPDGEARNLAAQEAAGRHGLAARVVHTYLFFKVPLLKPERWLAATLPLVAPLFTRTARIAVLLMALAGGYFTSRQWDQFAGTFLEFFTFEGALAYGVTLLVVKTLHELGHAYTAARLGVRVPSMGIAFMVMTPILYTDVSDAWRLRERRDKLAIDAAGIVVELALAGLAIFLWAFLPDGPLRAAAFITATTSLALGLAINLNPLMRFDGYYLLSDAWQVPNLQSRSAALAIWWLREVLFGLGRPAPDTFHSNMRATLIAYAIAAWIYRQALFLGIALVVYFMFFKALGIVLFVVEIAWFIAMPIVREMKDWWNMRSDIARSRRSAVTFAVCTAVLLLVLVPWNSAVILQGVALADLETRIYAPRPGRIASTMLADGKVVSEGQPLLMLDAPDLDHDIALTRRRIELAAYRLDRIAGDDADRSERVVLESELSRHQVSLDGLGKERARLVVVAPHDGVVRDSDPDLKAGEWLDEATPVGRVVRNAAVQVQGYLAEDDLWRIKAGAAVVFIPEDPQQARWHGRVTEVVQTGIRSVELPYLASIFGGAVPSDRGPDNEIRPRSGRHLVRVVLDGAPISRTVRGTLHVTGRPESFVSSLWRRVLQVLVRESSA